MSKYNNLSVPVIKKSRNKFDLSYSNLTSMSAGKLYPVYVQEVVPGDSFKLDCNFVNRVTSSFIRPIYGNIFQDVHFFYVPSRTVFDKFEQVFGENSEGYWINNSDVKVPELFDAVSSLSEDPDIVVTVDTVAERLGLPLGYNPYGQRSVPVSLLPFRAFAKIWNEWYRDENTQAPCYIYTGEATESEYINLNSWGPNNYTGQLPYVNKLHDYFTSALPSPQKGPDTGLFHDVPLNSYANWEDEKFSLLSNGLQFKDFYKSSYFSQVYTGAGAGFTGMYLNEDGQVRVGAQIDGGNVVLGDTSSGSGGESIAYTNLYADMSQFTINDFRQATMIQRMLELDARCGTRYVEYLLGHFGVVSPDSRLQRSEFLGGFRNPLNVQQVAQTAPGAADSNSAVGQLSAYSLSNGQAGFTKSFTEHGYIIGCSCIRQLHLYSQGIDRFWNRVNRLDFYDPIFAHLGEQPIYKDELDIASVDYNDNLNGPREIFGYQEAWADMRQRNNIITGQMRSDITNSLDVWHIGDDYASVPYLNQFIKETPNNINRVLTVPSTSNDQFIVDFRFNVSAIRVMPLYSIPGLVEHN